MTRLAETSSDLAHQAAEWVIRCDRGLSATEKTAFETWSAAPGHREEFARVAASWKALDRLASAPSLAAAADAIVTRARARRVRRRRVMVMAGGLFAAAAVLVFGLFLRSRLAPAPAGNYRVIASSSREISLPDGSLVTLNGDSRIETDYTPGERRVRLVSGEALFQVAKNPARPFYVTAGPVTVRAVGTAFNVRLGAAAVDVLVTEGKVRVDDRVRGVSLLPSAPGHAGAPGAPPVEGVLEAGQHVVINLASVADASAPAMVTAVAPAEMERALAWQSTQLIFNDTRLDEVVTAFNRYNRHQLVIGDPELAARKITGFFRADNLDGFTRLLAAGMDVKAEPDGDRDTVLRVAR